MRRVPYEKMRRVIKGANEVCPFVVMYGYLNKMSKKIAHEVCPS